ncbi:MAG: SPFH domain-containing protein [Candidatus Paceibacterota bacterium]
MDKTRTFISIVLAILATVGILGMIFTEVNVLGVNAGAILLALVLAYLVFSFVTVKTDEVGMVEVFGKPVSDLGPGLCFAPALVSKVSKESANLFQFELPAEPEKIFRKEDVEAVPAGMYPPNRIKFGSPDPNEEEPLKSDPYNIPMVADVVVVVSGRVKSLVRFKRTYGSLENLRKILSDRAVEACGVQFSKVTPAKALLSLKKTNDDLRDILQKEITQHGEDEKGGGFEFGDAYVKPFTFSHGLNKAVTGVKEAKLKAEAVSSTADGEKEKLEKEAAGTAAGIRAIADANKHRLLATGLAIADKNGDIIELVPDANVRVQTEAVKALKDVKGTVVLGNPNVMLGIKKGDDQ